MGFDFFVYGDKKEFNIVIYTKEKNKYISSLIETYDFPFSFKFQYLKDEKEIVDFAINEINLPLIILDESINYINVIKTIQESLENCKTQFIVLIEEVKSESNKDYLKNVLFIYDEFVNGFIFYGYFLQAITTYFLLLDHEIVNRRLKRLKSELSREKNFKSSVFNNIKEGFIILDTEGYILFANKIAEYILELEGIEYLKTPVEKYIRFSDEEKEVKSLGELISECCVKKKKLRKNMAEMISHSERNYIMNYELIPVFENGEKIYNVVFIFEDVTLQKRMWDEIAKKKNLETLGLISEGIIHDLNNQLTTILANVNLIKETISDENLYDYIVDVENASLKSKNIISDFISFSKGNMPLKKKGDIKELVEEVIHLLFRGSNIHISVSAEANLWPVAFDHSLMAQAIKNVLINSREAISRSGSIMVKIGNQVFTEKNPFSVKGGKYIKISIEDDGIGIPANLLDKIFDPNFSTKGKDRGLGLSIVNSIVSNHNGFIKVDSREKVGTVFQIFLPVSEEKKQIKKKSVGAIKKESNILVLEHDNNILGVLKKIFLFFEMKASFLTKRRLTEDDLNSLITSNGHDYLLIDTSGIEDRVMEGLIFKMRSKNPALKVIVLTHKHRYDSEDKIKQLGISAILYKPFTLEEFGEVFGEIIDAAHLESTDKI